MTVRRSHPEGRQPHRALPLALAALLGLGGCLGTTHQIPKEELARLAATPPEQRGDRVRVVQSLQTDDDPPAAAPVSVSTGIVLMGGPSRGFAPGPLPRPTHQARAESQSSKWWLIVASATLFVLAVQEGRRFDGWARLHPMHPVHLYGQRGEYAVLPLAQLEPSITTWVDRAYVRPNEGPWQPLERAPLDRKGFTFGLQLGLADIPSRDSSRAYGFMSHVQLGYFPAQVFGLLLDIGIGFRDNNSDHAIFDSRFALEFDVIPLRAGIFHAGFFTQFGLGAQDEDANFASQSRTDVLFGGGPLLQLELTTRLALTGKAGITFVHDKANLEFMLGLSVY